MHKPLIIGNTKGIVANLEVFMFYLKKAIYFVTALIIVYYIYAISVLLLKVGFKSASKEFFFLSLSIYLLIPVIKGIKYRKIITDDLILSYRINKILKKINFKNITKIQDVTIKNTRGETELPCIITTDNGIYNIYFCNYKGRYLISDDNNWFLKDKKSQLTKVESPINYIKENRNVLRENFNEEEIIDVIIMTDFFSNVIEKDNSTVPIIKINELPAFIEDYEGEDIFKEENIYDKLYPIIYKEKDLSNNLKIYNKYLDNVWQYRSRFTFICFSIMFYIFRVIGI